MKLNEVTKVLNISPTQVTRLAEESKIIRYRKKDEQTKSWEYDDESVYMYKQYMKEKAELEQKYNPTLTVIKRDGSQVKFDKIKILTAITNAYNDVYGCENINNVAVTRATDVAVNQLLRRNHTEFDISEIQSVVEQSLVQIEEFEVAKAYTEYRLTHDIARKQQTSVEFQVQRLFDKDDDIVNENANKDSDLYATQRDLVAGAVDKAVGLAKLPRAIADAHMAGLLHWHDMDYSPATSEHNCGLVDLKNMLANGFTLGNADVESPKSLTTAVAQACQILASIASAQYGLNKN